MENTLQNPINAFLASQWQNLSKPIIFLLNTTLQPLFYLIEKFILKIVNLLYKREWMKEKFNIYFRVKMQKNKLSQIILNKQAILTQT